MTGEDSTVELRFATVDQIIDELERRFDNILMAYDDRGMNGIVYIRRGDSTMAMGMQRELGLFLDQRWTEFAVREREET